MQLISDNKTEAIYDESISQMVLKVWYLVTKYHNHLRGTYGEVIIKSD